MRAFPFFSFILWLALASPATVVAQPTERAEWAIIPRPVSFRNTPGAFRLTHQTTLQADAAVPDQTLAWFQQAWVAVTGNPLPLAARGSRGKIRLSLDSARVPQAEGYALRVQPEGVELTGHDAAGVFYGLQSLLQLAYQQPGAPFQLPGCVVEDHPRFGYRGMQLDVSRHQFPVAFLKKYLDLLALYKFNTFHWHLTDDQGWRMEIKQYPALQQVAAYRRETLIGHKKELPHRFDGQRYGGYYTQDQIREVVQYAGQRHIRVIPEIEMPGHAMAALAAYPRLGCTGGPYAPATFWGIFDEVFCAGNDSTFTFLQNVLDEVLAVFPSEYIHIGGDECPKTRWKSCPRCQRRIREEKFKNEDELQSYFIRRIDRYMQSKGRQIIGWDEILEGGLSPGATVMSWRGTAGGREAIRQRHPAIMTPESHVYFDYYQSLYPDEPLASAGHTPLRKVYAYDPLPAGLLAQEAAYLKGVQGNVWTEYLPEGAAVEYAVFPRAIALAEVAWTPQEGRNYPDFLRRLRAHKPLLQRWQVHYADTFDEITDSVWVDPRGQVQLALATDLPRGIIRFTTNGSAPDARSPVYSQPLPIRKSGTVQAGLFAGGKPQGRIWQRTFAISKATGKPVTFRHGPRGNFRPALFQAAVNGVAGTTRYNTGEWFGFQGDSLDAIIDLQTVQTITSLGVQVLKYHWQRMGEPPAVHFSVSEDGRQYREVYTHRSFPANGINAIRTTIPAVKARYVRVRAATAGVIPAGQYGAGGQAWLLIDEFWAD